MTAAGLEARSIGKTYPTRDGALTILRDVSLVMTAGESLAIMGPSGSGKSTLLNIIGALEPPTSGVVTLDGENPHALDDDALAAFRNRRIGFVFQEHHLLPQCSALENVLLPTFARPRRNSSEGRATTGGNEAGARVLLERVGLSHRLDHRPGELSGGERQRVAIARALINEPVLILADEPTGNLDRASAGDVADLLLELQRERNVMLLTVTHSDELAARHGRRCEMSDGMLHEAPSAGAASGAQSNVPRTANHPQSAP